MAIDINNIKTQIKSILDTANIASATPRDLSFGMNERVQKVLKTNPANITNQASFFPFVTIYTDNKNIELRGIAKNQFNATREAEIDFKILGVVAEFNWENDTEDPADEEIERLMENVEGVLRNNDTLNGSVRWGFPTDVSYHSAAIDEETHVRAAIMNFKVKVFYIGETV